jgi:glycerol-3-phosphate dehydrogenase
VGTTDTTHEPGAQVWPTIERKDVEYLLEPLSRYFDIDPLKPADVVGAWAGLRPLIADPTKRNPSELSRRDELLIGPSGMLSVAGGKLTGYRGMARQVVQKVAERFEKRISELQNEPFLPGGNFSGDLDRLVQSITTEHGFGEQLARRLAQLYGTEVGQVLALGKQILTPGSRAVSGEIDWAIDHEGAVNLEDVIYRRLRLPLYETDAAHSLEATAQRMAERLGWDADEIRRQLATVRARLAQDLAFAGG